MKEVASCETGDHSSESSGLYTLCFDQLGGIAVKSVAFTARHMQLTMVSIINLFMAVHKTNVPRWPDRRCTRSSMALSNVFLAPLPGGFHPRIDCARTADHGFDARRLWKYLWNENSLLYIQRKNGIRTYL